MDRTGILWALGRRVPRRVGDAFARVAAPLVALKRLPAVESWADTIQTANGARPTKAQRRLLLENWLRNNLWSLSLAEWSDAEVLRVIDVDDADVAKLRESLAGPGLVLALPHMGSWDFAGAWCARVGIKVVSVAERLPGGLYERFSAARAGMGMTIYPVDQPDVMRLLEQDVRAGRLVCLLADRDLSAHGIKVPWPGSDGVLGVPAGPALLARRTGADFRVATTRFRGDRLRLEISERIVGDSPSDLMHGAVTEFADAVRRDPESWLMLRRAFR